MPVMYSKIAKNVFSRSHRDEHFGRCLGFAISRFDICDVISLRGMKNVPLTQLTDLQKPTCAKKIDSFYAKWTGKILLVKVYLFNQEKPQQGSLGKSTRVFLAHFNQQQKVRYLDPNIPSPALTPCSCVYRFSVLTD